MKKHIVFDIRTIPFIGIAVGFDKFSNRVEYNILFIIFALTLTVYKKPLTNKYR
jgi:hypothetical protein